jgi:hypothetical protein
MEKGRITWVDAPLEGLHVDFQLQGVEGRKGGR